MTRQVLIRIKPEAMTSLGIGIDQVINAIRAANQDVPAGPDHARPERRGGARGGQAQASPRSSSASSSPSRAAARCSSPRSPTSIDGEKEETSFARINGRPAITIDLQKAQDANIVDTGRFIVQAVEASRRGCPPASRSTVVNSTAETVEKSVNRVKQTIVEGALLTVLIVFLFLHSWRSTVITGLTLPISVVATFIALYAFGFTLNFLTLMALSLCIGLLIDDAIVVRENIVRHLAMGKSHRQAAQEATDEIGLAVMATTFAIVAVFVPIAFMQGIIGQLLLPVRRHGHRRGAGQPVRSVHARPDALVGVGRPARGPLPPRAVAGPADGGIERGVEAHAPRVRARARLGARAPQVRARHRASSLFLASFAVPPLVGTEFVPEADESFISLRLNTPVGSSLEYTDSKVRQVEEALKAFPEIRLAMTTVGTEEGRNYARD